MSAPLSQNLAKAGLSQKVLAQDELTKGVLVNEQIEALREFLKQYHYGFTIEYFDKPVPENDYGLQWRPEATQLTKELYGYWKGGIGGKTAFEHMVAAIRLELPNFQFISKGILNTNALRVLKACCEYRDLGIAGSASSGKTYPVAAFILIDWLCAPNQTLSLVCTTTVGAAEDRIWGTIVKLHKEAAVPYGQLVEHRKMIVYGGFDEEKAQDREPTNAIKAIAVPKGEEGKKAISNFRGRKNARVRVVFDELPEMDLYTIDVRVNLASNPDFRFIGIGNPGRRTGDPHGRLCEPKAGWESVNRSVPEWDTITGKCIFLNGEWSPNFLVNEDEPPPFPRLTNRKTRADMLRLCYQNDNSLEYIRNAVGFWVEDETLRILISRTIIKAYEADGIAKWLGDTPKILAGLDLGFTFGGDLCVAQFGKLARDISGRTILSHFKEKIYHAVDGEIFEDSIARQFVKDCIDLGVEPRHVGLDISNDGGKIMQQIIKYWRDDPELKKQGRNNRNAFDIIAISSNGKPTTRPVSNVDPRPASHAYDRRVTELWGQVREAIMSGVIKGIDLTSDMVAQLCAREYDKQKGQNGDKTVLETKTEMKKRLKVSPDKADAFVYLVEVAIRSGLEFITEDSFSLRRLEAAAKRRPIPMLQNSAIGSYGSDSWGEESSL